MAKETKKSKIERLEKEIQELKCENGDLNIKIAKKIFDNMDLKKRLEVAEHFNEQNNINMLTIRATKQGIEIERLNGIIQELNNEKVSAKNERGAGRKAKLDDKKDEIKGLRIEGYKISELATKYNCSVGLIHKLISE